MAVDRFGLVVVICLVIAAVSVARYEKVDKRGVLEDMGLKDLLSGIMSKLNKKIENAIHDPNGKKTVVSDSVVSCGNETKRIKIHSYFDPDDKNNSTAVQPLPTVGNNSTNNGSSLATGNNSTTIQRKPILQIFAGWLYSFQFDLTHEIDLAILRAGQVGLLDKWTKEQQTLLRQQEEAEEGREARVEFKNAPITLWNLQAMFLLFVIGNVLATVAFIVENTIGSSYYKKRSYWIQELGSLG